MTSVEPTSRSNRPPAGEPHRMAQPEDLLDGDVVVPGHPMIVLVLEHMQPVVQRAAESDVHLLDPPADSEHRHLRRDAGPHHRQRGRVALGVDRFVVGERRAVVVVGLDVRTSTGEHQSVDALDEGLDLEPLAERRQHHRHAAGEPLDRVDVLRPGTVDEMAPVLELHHARGHAHERHGVGRTCGLGLVHGSET